MVILAVHIAAHLFVQMHGTHDDDVLRQSKQIVFGASHHFSSFASYRRRQQQQQKQPSIYLRYSHQREHSSMLGQLLDQFCSAANSSETQASSNHHQLPDNAIDDNAINSNTSAKKCDETSLANAAAQVSQGLNNQSGSKKLGVSLKHSILYEHLLKDIPPPSSKNSDSRSTSKDSNGPANAHRDLENGTPVKHNSQKHNNKNNHRSDRSQSIAEYSKDHKSVLNNDKANYFDVESKEGKIMSDIMNLSTKSKVSNDDDASVPLNLTVKKSTAASSSANSNEGNRLPSNLIVNHLVNSNRQPTLSHPLLNQQNQYNSSSSSIIPQQQQQKKRGRKPKALLNNSTNDSAQFLNNFSDLAAMANSFLTPNSMGLQATHTSSTPTNNVGSEGKPRKRGRPPTLSPPHNSIQPLAAHAKANSSGAFNASYPFNLFNTPDVLSSWPGLNALTAAAAAAAAAAAGSGSFPNNQHPFNIFNKLNAKDINNFNMNLLNSNLFNMKNLPSQENDFLNNKQSSKSERRPKQQQQLLHEESNSQLPKNVENSSSSKGSFAHKPHPNEKQLRIPLNHGWKRLTYITGFSKQGTIEGEVSYVAPCGKKIKNFPELIRYLTRNSIAHLARDNFSFDTNVIVGQFIENIQELSSEVLLTESQIKVQLEEINKIRNFGLPSTSNQVQANNNMLPEKKRRVRDSGGTRNVYDSIKSFKPSVHKNMFDSNSSKNDFEPSITITVQNSPRGSKRKSLEQNKSDFLRAEKLLKKQEEERQLRELREKQEEERKMKEAQERQLEIQKQEEMKLLAEIERERANQHQMFIHALTEIQTSEQREAKKEEIAREKSTLQERKIIKRALEVELQKEMKKPVEDMMLKDLKDLPTFNRIPGLKLTGKAFADALMVFEFLFNFGETIGFDTDSLPNLNTLMMALLSLDDEAEEELMSIVIHLVVCAIEDPGMPTNMTTAMGQKLKDANVTMHNLTEILRLYFQSFDSIVHDEDRHKRVECKIYDELCTGIPFLAMNATNKLNILVFLCNELLCNQAIVKQIDENIESVTSFKKDKWLLENDIRKLKLVKMKRERITEIENAKLKEASENCENETAESDNEETSTTVVVTAPVSVPAAETEDDISMTNEEIDKKVDKLNKQCNNMNNKLNRALNSYRVFPLGQDRYRRTYWILPNCGGVFVEAMESGEPDELANNVIKCDDDETVHSKTIKEEGTDEEEQETNLNGIKEEEDEENKVKVEFTEKDSVGEEMLDETKSDVSSEHNQLQIDAKEDEEEEAMDVQQSENDQKEHQQKDDSSVVATASDEQMVAETTDDSAKLGNCDAKQNEEANQKEQTGDSQAEDELEGMKWFDLFSMNCDPDECEGDVDDEKKPDDEDDDDDDEKLDDESEKDEKDSQLYHELEQALRTYLDEATMQCLFGCVEQNEDAAILKECLLRVLSTFPKSANTTKFPNSDVTESEITVCPNLQKRIQAWKSAHYGVARKIAREFQLGWWRITDPTQLKSLLELFHNNALRERNLQKSLEKHMNYAIQSCKITTANLEVNDFDREVSETREHGAPTENICPHKECHSDGYCVQVAMNKNLQVLELIEAFEEKILSSSMQIRNWKPSAQTSSADFKLRLPSVTNSTTNSWSKSGKGKSSKKKQRSADNSRDSFENDSSENGFFNNENTANSDSSLSNGSNDNFDDDLLAVQKDKLLEIESSIERRYLKPPLGFKNNNMVVSSSTADLPNGDEFGEYAQEENAPAGLLRWRDAVHDATCSSQIAMCLHFLENCIAWDKSVMRASCQFCGSGENEAQLLLCDLCDKGWHTYCFKPQMSVPAGDWFCFDCQNKNTIDKVCIVCGKKGKLLNCDTCAKVFHPNCLDPPITKQLKGRWSCHLCLRNNKNKRQSPGSANKSSKKSNSNFTSAGDDLRNSDSLNSSTSTNHKETKRISNGNGKEKPEKEGKKERKSNKANKEDKEKNHKEKNNSSNKVADNNALLDDTNDDGMNIEIDLCRQLMEAMEKHESCWPFLEPVNTKQFPTYKKIIKRPMDFSIIRTKFDSNTYKTRDDFANDIRLMFDNCVTFNEDESPVGQAGHNLRAFFESKWQEIFASV